MVDNGQYIIGSGVFIALFGTVAAVSRGDTPIRPIIGGIAVVALLGLLQASGAGSIARGLAVLSVVSVAAYNGQDMINFIGGINGNHNG
jgi:hypothetical protein